MSIQSIDSGPESWTWMRASRAETPEMYESGSATTVYPTCKAPGSAADACAAGRDARDGAFRDATVATIGFGAAAAGAVATTAVLLWPRPRARATTGAVTVTPLVGPLGGGAVVRAAF